MDEWNAAVAKAQELPERSEREEMTDEELMHRFEKFLECDYSLFIAVQFLTAFKLFILEKKSFVCYTKYKIL